MKISFTKKMSSQVVVNLIALVIVVISISACSKDDDKGPSNYFTADGTSQALSTAQLRISEDDDKDASGNTVYHHELVFLSDGFTTSTAGDITGTGDALDFVITTSSASQLPAGKYTFTAASAPATFTFSEGTAYLGYSASTFKATTEYDVAGGTFTVATSGTNYTIDFEGTAAVSGTTATKAFTIHYTGTLASY